MASMEAIRRLTIQARTEGVDRAAAELSAVDAAQRKVASSADLVATATTQTERRQASVLRSYEALRGKVDEQVRAEQNFARAKQTADRALAQGVTTIQEHARTLDKARAHYGLTATANDNLAKSTGLARHEMINLGRQVQDIGVSLAGGMSPFMVLTQQGSQVADIFTSSQGSLRGFAAQIRGMVTPMTALAIGTVALGAGIYGALTYWKNFALALDDTARTAGMTSSEMAKLQAAAAFKGIADGDFASGMRSFAGSVYQAQQGMGPLADLMRANGQSAKTTADYFDRVADLIKRSRDDQQRLQILQQAGLPATLEWARLLEKGAAGLADAKAKAVEFGGAANDEMIRKAREFDEMWNRAWTNFGLYARGAVVAGVSAIGSLMQKAEDAVGRLNPGTAMESAREELRRGRGSRLGADSSTDPFYFGSVSVRPTGNESRTVDPNAIRQSLSLEQQRIGMLGELASVQEQVRAKEIEIQLARMSGVRITRDEEKALLDLARAQTALGRLQSDVRFERDTLGMSQTDQMIASRLRAAYPREGEWQSQMNGALASQMRFNAALRESQQLGTEFAQGFVSDLVRGTSAMEALTNAVQRLASRLAQMAADAAIRSLFGSLFGGGGAPMNLSAGTVGGTGLGGFGGFFADGGYLGPGQWGIAGENGPEPIYGGRTGMTVVPNGSGGGGGNITIVVQGARGNAEIASMIEIGVTRGLDAYDHRVQKQFKDVPAQVRVARQYRPRFA